MTQRRNVIQTTQDLADTNLGRPSDFGTSEIAGGQSRFQADLDNGRLDDLVEIAHIQDFLERTRGTPGSTVNLLGDGCLHVLEHLDLEERPEEVTEKESRRINTLIRIRISVVITDALVCDPQ